MLGVEGGGALEVGGGVLVATAGGRAGGGALLLLALEHGAARVGAREGFPGREGLEGAGEGSLKRGALLGGGLDVLALGVADLAARFAAVPSQGELALAEVVHAQVEELHGERTAARGDGVDSQVHVAVRGELVVAD